MVQTTNNHIKDTKHTLSIQVSLNGLSFCIVNANKQIVTLEKDAFGIQLTPEQVLQKIKHHLDTNPFLETDFETIEVIHQNMLYSIVPKALFDENTVKEYLNYNVRLLQNDFIAYDELDQHEMNIVYVPYTNINNFFFETFGAFTYKHISTILLNTLLLQEKNSDTSKAFANMNDKSFDLVIIVKGKLILANSYHHTTKEDFLYYLLFTIEQTKLNARDFSLVFLGNIQKTSDYYDIACTYIKNVDFGSHDQNYSFASSTNPIQPHEYFSLLSHF
ncbi:DUF3822 family protein [Aquimarina sp. U1-2]|uniref:DUF3822 family protein n=1 Tax=Aquimarina sp. U1-2 TaxID=2823141 RepID=UPI001AEC7DB5|nr:DUF3822 family protein [Aquimarina sp. U1-2]MBP2832110.1 DUF3822 family protein [Aquimarina sp. U1-2]